MRPHPRIRKTIKWGGLVVAIALLLLTLWTSGWHHMWTGFDATHVRTLGVGEGFAYFLSFKLPPNVISPDGHTTSQSLRVIPRSIRWWVKPNRGIYNARIGVPLWIPALASLTLSGFAWRLDTLATRRLKLDACPTCSYPRTGLAPSAPCPECGAAAPQA